MHYASFYIEDGLYAIPVLLVEEFLRPADVTPVPLTDKRLEGLINLRGKTATVLNLRRCLDKPDLPGHLRSKMILLETEEGLTEEARMYGIESHAEPLVLRVDAVHRILTLEAGDIHPPPAHVAYAFVSGVSRLAENNYVTVLSIPLLIEELMTEEGV